MATVTYGDKRKAQIEPVRVVGVGVDVDAPGATIDGVAMAVGDSVAVAGETSIGIYEYQGAATPMTRRDDRPADCTPGTLFSVLAGDAYGGAIGVVGSAGAVSVFFAQPKSNFGGSVAPTLTDDEASGYAKGSQWLDSVAGKLYVCVDADVGAAVWEEITLVA